MAKCTRRTFTEKFKAVRVVRESGKAIGVVVGSSISPRGRCAHGCGRPPLPPTADRPALTTEERAELRRLRREVRTLRMERDILTRATAPSPRRTSEVRVHRRGEGRLPRAGAVRTLGVSRAGFYAWPRRAPAAQTQPDLRLGLGIQAIHAESRQCCDSPRAHAELRRRGHRLSRKRVARLMSQHRLAVAPNALARRIAVAARDAAWVTNVTNLWTNEGWL
jgi:transposase-like protein